jgi:hypothetical protein
MTISGNILLPAAYFPPIKYFVEIICSKTILIEQMETFPKQTYRNRCEIMTAAGRASLIVPVTKPQGNHTMTRDIEICYREPWQQHQWKTLETAYRSSPFFSYYADIIQPLFESREISLLMHNQDILAIISRLIGIDLAVEFTQDYIKRPENIIDLRSEISPKKHRALHEFPAYPQVFGHIYGFIGGLSILDLLFNIGPDSVQYLKSIGIGQ